MNGPIEPVHLERLVLALSPELRTTLTGWLTAYYQATADDGPVGRSIETMLPAIFAERGCHRGWLRTTQPEWLAGAQTFALYFKDLDLRFEGAVRAGRPVLRSVIVHPAPPPSGESWIGVLLAFDAVAVAPAGASPGLADLVDLLWARASARWLPFADDLRRAVEADAEAEEARAVRLTSDFVRGEAAGRRCPTGETGVVLGGVRPETCAELNDGEWVILLDETWQERGRGTVLAADAEAGEVLLRVNGNHLPPAGKLQPLVRTKIVDQKRGIVAELQRPTGALPDLLRLLVTPRAVVGRTEGTPAAPGDARIAGNRARWRAVRLALGLEPGEVLLVQGPPGTGKSSTAAEMIDQLLRRDPHVRILVASHSNHGVDNMLAKFLPHLSRLGPQARPARVGKRERLHAEAKAFYVEPGTPLDHRNVIFTTCDSLALQDSAGAGRYDYVFLDEANRATIMDSLLVLARGARCILIGDDLQLPPVLSEAERALVDGGVDAAATASLFHWLLGARCAAVLLDVQNRMHPAIGTLISRTFYEGRVRNGGGLTTRPIAPGLFAGAAYWIDTRALAARREVRGGRTSRANPAEAALIRLLLSRLRHRLPPGASIGVIAMYAEQRDLLRRTLHRGPAGDPTILVDTVDAFEGRECDVVIVSMVRSNDRGAIGFLDAVQRVNVAVSRARRLLLIVGDTTTLRGGCFAGLQAGLAATGTILDARQVIARLAPPRRRPAPAVVVAAPAPAVAIVAA